MTDKYVADISNFTEILQHVTPKTLILLDIDQVCLDVRTIEEVFPHTQHPVEYVCPDPDIEQITIGDRKFFNQFESPVYPGLKNFIDLSQNIGAKVVAFTRPCTIKWNHLSKYFPKIGVHFVNYDFNDYELPNHTPQDIKNYGYSNGIIYCGNYSAPMNVEVDGEILQLESKSSHLNLFFLKNPDLFKEIDNVIFVDDMKENLDGVELVVQKIIKCKSVMVHLDVKNSYDYDKDIIMNLLSLSKDKIRDKDLKITKLKQQNIHLIRLGIKLSHPYDEELDRILAYYTKEKFNIESTATLALLQCMFSETCFNKLYRSPFNSLPSSDRELLKSTVSSWNTYLNCIINFLLKDYPKDNINLDTLSFFHRINERLDTITNESNIPKKFNQYLESCNLQNLYDYNLVEHLLNKNRHLLLALTKQSFSIHNKSAELSTFEPNYEDIILSTRKTLLSALFLIPVRLFTFISDFFVPLIKDNFIQSSSPEYIVITHNDNCYSFSFKSYLYTVSQLFVSLIGIPGSSCRTSTLEQKIEIINNYLLPNYKRSYEGLLSLLD